MSQSSSVQSTETFSADDFSPLSAELAEDSQSRPSLSYWSDAWRRLQQDKRALFSLYLIVLLLGFISVGPVIWQVDPSAQDVDQIGISPGADRSVLVAPPRSPWLVANASDYAAPLSNANPLGLALAEAATTEAVRLVWQQDVSAPGGFRIYRNIYATAPSQPAGLPIFTIKKNLFEDRLDLQAQRYYYTVIALNERGEETNLRSRLSVDVKRVISLQQARQRGLIDNDVPMGSELQLAWHPLGTDHLGRDMLARLMAGGQVSLFIGLVAPMLFVMFGVAYGSIAGFFGGNVDQAMMRFADIVIALPFLLFMILFKVIFGIGPGESGIWPMLLAMVILSWPGAARLVRGQILQIREEAYISASQLMGGRTGYIISRHMLPNTMGVILVTLTFQVPGAIFTEAFLSFIGLGVAPPTPSWGAMCNEGIKSMLTRPHELIFPAMLISITVLAFNMAGDGLRDALDARMRGSE